MPLTNIGARLRLVYVRNLWRATVVFLTNVTLRISTCRERIGSNTAAVCPQQKVSTSDTLELTGGKTENKKIAINERVSGCETDTTAAATSRGRNLSLVRFSPLKTERAAHSKSPPCRAGYNEGRLRRTANALFVTQLQRRYKLEIPRHSYRYV